MAEVPGREKLKNLAGKFIWGGLALLLLVVGLSALVVGSVRAAEFMMANKSLVSIVVAIWALVIVVIATAFLWRRMYYNYRIAMKTMENDHEKEKWRQQAQKKEDAGSSTINVVGTDQQEAAKAAVIVLAGKLSTQAAQLATVADDLKAKADILNSDVKALKSEAAKLA